MLGGLGHGVQSVALAKKVKDVSGRKLMTKKFLQKEIPIPTWKLNQRMIGGDRRVWSAGRDGVLVALGVWRSEGRGLPDAPGVRGRRRLLFG